MSGVLTEFINILVGGISAMGTGIASGVKDTASALFLDTSGTTPALSEFGGICAILFGVSLACTLTFKIFTWITTLGN